MSHGGSRTKGRRINYPKNRKSPHKHEVGSHMRKGKRIDEFTRGKGRKPADKKKRVKKSMVMKKVTTRKPGKLKREHDFKSSRMTIQYVDGTSGVIAVPDGKYVSAMGRGIAKADPTKMRKRVTLVGVR